MRIEERSETWAYNTNPNEKYITQLSLYPGRIHLIKNSKTVTFIRNQIVRFLFNSGNTDLYAILHPCKKTRSTSLFPNMGIHTGDSLYLRLEGLPCSADPRQRPVDVQPTGADVRTGSASPTDLREDDRKRTSADINGLANRCGQLYSLL